MTYRGNARPVKSSAPPLTARMKAELVPVIRSLWQEGRSDPQIVAHLRQHGPVWATRAQVERIRRSHGLVMAYQKDIERAGRGQGLAMLPGIRERFIEQVRELAAEAKSDSQIARELGHGITRHQVYFLRHEYGIRPGRHGPVLAQKRRAAAAGQPEPEQTVAPNTPMPAPAPSAAIQPAGRRIGTRTPRTKDRVGMDAVCNFCHMAVSALADDTAEPHKRILPDRYPGGIVRLADCTGAGRVVRWEPKRDELAVAA